MKVVGLVQARLPKRQPPQGPCALLPPSYLPGRRKHWKRMKPRRVTCQKVERKVAGLSLEGVIAFSSTALKLIFHVMRLFLLVVCINHCIGGSLKDTMVIVLVFSIQNRGLLPIFKKIASETYLVQSILFFSYHVSQLA